MTQQCDVRGQDSSCQLVRVGNGLAMTYLFTSSVQHRADSLHATTYSSHYCYCVARSAAA